MLLYGKTSGNWLPRVAVIALLSVQPLVAVRAKSCCRAWKFRRLAGVTACKDGGQCITASRLVFAVC